MGTTTKATKRNRATKATNATQATRSQKRQLNSPIGKDMLPQCFLNEGGKFIWMAKGGIPAEQQLPYVMSKYESALIEAGVPYRQTYIPNKYKEGEELAICEYWDPECPMQEKKLPVYIKLENSNHMYMYTGDMVTRQVVSGKVVHLANKLTEKVRYACAKKDLNGKTATVVRMNKKTPKEVTLEGDDGTIKILQAHNAEDKPTGYCGIFNMKDLEDKYYVELHVPKNIAGTVIGKGGKNKKAWDNILAKNLVVVSEE